MMEICVGNSQFILGTEINKELIVVIETGFVKSLFDAYHNFIANSSITITKSNEFVVLWYFVYGVLQFVVDLRFFPRF